MAWHEIYVNEKLREFRELNSKTAPRHSEEPPRRPKPVVGPIARKAGRVLRRFGEGLESWGAPSQADAARRAQYQ